MRAGGINGSSSTQKVLAQVAGVCFTHGSHWGSVYVSTAYALRAFLLRRQLFKHPLNGKVSRDNASPTGQGREESYGLMVGTLTLRNSSQTASLSEQDKTALEGMLKNLTWMMFHLGGVGQGARRPCYSRQNRERAPWWRGSTLIAKNEEPFWDLPDSVQGFQKLFRQRLQDFYNALAVLAERKVNPRSLLNVGRTTPDKWVEAVDAHCQIIVCAGQSDFGKPYALSVLHNRELKRGDNYDGNLCGKVGREVKPSPVWIADLEEYQVITVFGATQDPRKKYLQELRDRTSSQNYSQIFPLL